MANYYNEKLLITLSERLSKLPDFSKVCEHAYVDGFGDDGSVDLYSYIASIMYDKDISECKELGPDDTPNPEGKDLRNRVKQFLIPIIEECGGVFSDDVDTEAMPYKKC